jgi:hypothetical protein
MDDMNNIKDYDNLYLILVFALYWIQSYEERERQI